MESKFCTSCQTSQPLESGRYLWSGRIKRWRCAHCLKHADTKENMDRRAVARKQVEDICAIRTANKADDVLVKTRIGEEI